VLASDIIGCQEGSGSLSFLVWKSSIPAVLRICVRTPPGERGKLECRQNLTDFMGFDWVPITIVTPASTKPFQLVLVALIQRATDTIGIDNITYTSRLCGRKTLINATVLQSQLQRLRFPNLNDTADISTLWNFQCDQIEFGNVQCSAVLLICNSVCVSQ